MNITDEEVERLARELAAETGESIPDVIRKSLRERLTRIRGHYRLGEDIENVDGILTRMDALPRINSDPEDQILGYDENGLPSAKH